MIREWNITGFAFFYHNDHLGSAAYLTDKSGTITQTLNYLPYGEDWIDIRENLDPNLGQYTFNGKEKDWESGFHYFGARYYWSEVLTGWLSVDRYADKYPGISPYSYCVWNPIKLIDPSGDTVVVKGAHADRIVEQLQTGQMIVLRDESGVLSTDLRGKTRENLSREERLVYDAINSTKVTVNITAQKTEKLGGKNVFRATIDGKTDFYECLYGGSNMGSYYNPNTNMAVSYGLIDMDLVEANGYDQGVAHEVSEYYIAGQIAIRYRSHINYAEQNVRNPRMMEAHNMAIPEVLQKGGIYQFGIKFGNMGKIK